MNVDTLSVGGQRLGQRPTDRAQFFQRKGGVLGGRRHGDRRGRGGRGRPAPVAPLRQQLLDSADRIALVAQQTMDAARQRHVVGAIITSVPGPLQRLELGKARLPIAQDVLRQAKLGGKLADRPEGWSLLPPGSP